MKTLVIFVFSASLLLSISSLAADSKDDLAAEKRSIEEFVLPDGRLDIEAVRNSGYQGTLDLNGFDVGIDPRTGEPLVQVSASLSSLSDPDDIYWSTLGSGMNAKVTALTVYNNKLIAGGSFTTAGGVFANNIASWDGTSWSALGTGMNDNVWVLTVYNNKLIAGGTFNLAGGMSAKNIASWDGSSWSALGTGMDNIVYALTVYDSQLVAGGEIYDCRGCVGNSYCILGRYFLVGFGNRDEWNCF